MKPVSPVFPDERFWDEEINVAENQQEYMTLPVLDCGGGVILSRWELDDKDLAEINKNRSVYVFMTTFGKPVTPILLQTEMPKTEQEIAAEKQALD